MTFGADMAGRAGNAGADDVARDDRDFLASPTASVIATIPWRAAVDVWISCSSPNQGILAGTASIFARTGSARVRVAYATVRYLNGCYVCGVRNIVCDAFDVEFVGSGVPVSGISSGHVTCVGRGRHVTGAPLVIPAAFQNQDPATPFLRDPPLGGAGEYGAGAQVVDPLALFNFNRFLQGTCNLVEIWGYNNTAGALFFQLFDSASAVQLGNGTQSLADFPVPANGTFSFRPQGGRRFATGLFGQWSSTPRTMTTVAGTPGWAEASFYP